MHVSDVTGCTCFGHESLIGKRDKMQHNNDTHLLLWQAVLGWWKGLDMNYLWAVFLFTSRDLFDLWKREIYCCGTVRGIRL